MKLNRDMILEILKKYNFNPQDYIVISGAALVLYGVKEYTSDIDIAVSNKLYNEILKEHNCSFEIKINNHKVWFIDNIINFSKRYYDVEYTELFGYKVQTIDSIIDLKRNLNREKDMKDIQLIINFCKQKDNGHQ